jgi:hypothetical protein
MTAQVKKSGLEDGKWRGRCIRQNICKNHNKSRQGELETGVKRLVYLQNLRPCRPQQELL